MPLTTQSEAALENYLDGRQQLNRLRTSEARLSFMHAVEADSNFALAYLDLARTAGSDQQFYEYLEKAVSLTDRVSVSEAERLRIQAVAALAIEGRPQKARNLYLRLADMYPEDEHVQFYLANHYFHQQRYRECVEHARQALQIDSDFSPPYNLLGYAHQSLGEFGEAEAAFRTYEELIPGEPNPYDSYGDLLLRMGRYEEAIEKYNQALELNQAFIYSIVGVATAFNCLEEHAKARKVLRDVLDYASDLSRRRILLQAMAISYVDEGRYDSAATELRRLLAGELDAEDVASAANTLMMVGNVHLEAGQIQMAEQAFDSALLVVRQSSLSDDIKDNAEIEYRYNRARVAIENGQFDTAQQMVQRHLEDARERVNPPMKSQAHFLKALIALKKEAYKEALAHFDETDLEDPYHQYHKALALLGLERTREAQQLLKDATHANLKNSFRQALVRSHGRQSLANN